MLVTDMYEQLTWHISLQEAIRQKNIVNNKCIKRWLNVGRLHAEYKQVIQKSRIECLKGIVYIGWKRECKTILLNLLE